MIFGVMYSLVFDLSELYKNAPLLGTYLENPYIQKSDSDEEKELFDIVHS